MQPANYLMNILLIVKLHDGMLKQICEDQHLSSIEANIIRFLHNNPGLDTAGDIVQMRMLSKGNVSQGVEALIRKGLLARTPDTADRRKIHLSLLPASNPVTDAVDRLQGQLGEELFSGFSSRELELFNEFNCRLMENAKEIKKRRDQANEE